VKPLPRICDYEGSQYRAEFWENKNRQYEDLAERIAIRKLLPPSGKRIVEVGAGFGRLVDLYQDYEQIILLDYARTQLEEAQRFLAHDDRFIFVVADLYRLPFIDNSFDALVMVRVMHHITEVRPALQEIRRIVQAAGTVVIEHASKRHLKSILRWLLRRQSWSPFSHTPHEFVELNIDFHPAWMRQQFAQAGLNITATRTVSHYRLPILKRLLPATVLATLDGLLQPTGELFQYSPSIFLQARPKQGGQPAPIGPTATVTDIFRCPNCLCQNLEPQASSLNCPQCNRQWGYQNGIYDFKTPSQIKQPG